MTATGGVRDHNFVGMAVLYAVLGALFNFVLALVAVVGVLAHGWQSSGRQARLRKLWLSSDSLMRWGLGPTSRRSLVVGALVGLGLAATATALGLLIYTVWPPGLDGYRAPAVTDSLSSGDAGLTLLTVLTALIAVVLAPIGEEIVFRGMVGSELTSARWPPVRIWLATTIVFVLVHVDFTVLGVTARLLVGSVLWLLWHRTGSVWPGIVAHGAHNGALLVAVLMGL